MDPTRRFAANLRRARRTSGLSQQHLAVRCRLHRTEISLLERGEREPRLSTIVRLAHGLRVPPSALLDGIESRGPAKSRREDRRSRLLRVPESLRTQP